MTYFIYTYERGINKKLQVYIKRNAKQMVEGMLLGGFAWPQAIFTPLASKGKERIFSHFSTWQIV
jgi:hypothetical protein